MENIIYYSVISILVITFIFNLWLNYLNYKNRTAEIPKEVENVYNHDDYSKWLNYTMEHTRLGFISSIVSFILTLYLLLFGLFPLINKFAEELSQSLLIQTLIFIGLYFIITFIIGIFFSYYEQFSIEERYGFNKSTKKTFITDKIKNLILTLIIGGGLLTILTLIYQNVKNPQTFYLVSLGVIISIILIINVFYVKLIVPIFNKLTPLEEGPLKERIVGLAEKVGYQITKINIMNASKRSTKLNAFFSGFGKFKQVVLYDTLVEKMTDNQILSVLAHEIGHSKLNHLVKNLVITVLNIAIYLGVLLYTIYSDSLSQAFGFDQANFGFGLIAFMILISPVTIIIAILTSHISRRFEYQADQYAVVNGYKQAMEESLKVIARENYANLTPHPLYVAFHYSHPPIAFRIRAIRKINV